MIRPDFQSQIIGQVNSIMPCSLPAAYQFGPMGSPICRTAIFLHNPRSRVFFCAQVRVAPEKCMTSLTSWKRSDLRPLTEEVAASSPAANARLASGLQFRRDWLSFPIQRPRFKDFFRRPFCPRPVSRSDEPDEQSTGRRTLNSGANFAGFFVELRAERTPVSPRPPENQSSGNTDKPPFSAARQDFVRSTAKRVRCSHALERLQAELCLTGKLRSLAPTP